jgi:hypothetical protein
MALLPGSAYAKECQAKFTANAAAVENRESVIKKGTILTYATQYRIDRRTNDASVCFKGGYCYPAQKIKLSCKVDWKSGESFDGDPTVIYYYK